MHDRNCEQAGGETKAEASYMISYTLFYAILYAMSYTPSEQHDIAILKGKHIAKNENTMSLIFGLSRALFFLGWAQSVP
jgi:hypothetical protein